MIQLKKCSVTVMVSDLDKSVRFYTETLGLKLANRYGNHYAEIETPNLTIGLHPSASFSKGTNMSIGLGVDDLNASVRYLNENGMEIKIEQDGNIKLAHFTDPDDNPLYLVEV